MVEVPAGLRASLARADPSTGPWLDRLPSLAAEFLDRWSLRADGRPMHGVCALVLPVRRPDGVPAVLKLSWPHSEARDEHLALRVWAGEGAVRLLGAAPEDYVVLLERLDATRDLVPVPLGAALHTAGELIRRLGVPADDGLVRVDERAREWSTELAVARRRPPDGVPTSLLDHAAAVLPDLLAGAPAVLLHTDLHYENVLAADRDPWLAIDPKPLLGDPAYEVAPLLWNRWSEATSAADLGRHLRWRADVVADAAGLEPARVAGWVVVREAVQALDAVADGDPVWRDMSVAVAEAFQHRVA
ncbi:MAG: aminoglycoside phosphotransferase family protein [Jiangellaceae bacterium]